MYNVPGPRFRALINAPQDWTNFIPSVGGGKEESTTII